MKTGLILTVLATAVFAQTGPFGLHRGMTEEEVIRIVGRGALVKTQADVRQFTTVPKPHNAFEDYSLVFSPKDGLLKISAFGIDIRTNSYGDALQRAFSDLRDGIIGVYGHPHHCLDEVRAGSIWKEPEDWMMGLLKEERQLICM